MVVVVAVVAAVVAAVVVVVTVVVTVVVSVLPAPVVTVVVAVLPAPVVTVVVAVLLVDEAFASCRRSSELKNESGISSGFSRDQEAASRSSELSSSGAGISSGVSRDREAPASEPSASCRNKCLGDLAATGHTTLRSTASESNEDISHVRLLSMDR